jgi:hypothetical protein
MLPTLDDKLSTSVFSLGLTLSFLRREDVVRWADRRIGEVDVAPEWLINLSLSQDANLMQLIGDLKQIADGVDPSATCKGAYSLVPNRGGVSFDEAEELAKLLYRIAYRSLGGDWHNSLLRESDSIADMFCLVRDGYAKLSEQQAIDRLFSFIERNRDSRFVELIQPVVWSFRSEISDAIARGRNAAIYSVGVSAWIIQDGNYPDFAVGDKCEFALEFHPQQDLQPVMARGAITEHITGSRYLIRGQIVFVEPNVWVIDAGPIIAYQETKPPPFAVAGMWVEGEVYIGIDPFFYFEGLYRLEGMPVLSYIWLVRQIMLETTPWIETKDAKGRRVLTRDKSRESFVPTRETKAWTADDGNAHYVMKCERLTGPERPRGRK